MADDCSHFAYMSALGSQAEVEAAAVTNCESLSGRRCTVMLGPDAGAEGGVCASPSNACRVVELRDAPRAGAPALGR